LQKGDFAKGRLAGRGGQLKRQRREMQKPGATPQEHETKKSS
jgi:hypothetical protein